MSHATLARATGSTYTVLITQDPDFGHGPLLSGTGRRVGTHLVITVRRMDDDDLIGGRPVLSLTHGRTRVHVPVSIDCQACGSQT